MAPVIVAYAAAGVGLVTFGVFGALALSKNSQLEECSPLCANSEVNLAKTQALVADIGLAVGVIGGVVGTLLLLNRDSSEDSQAAIEVAPWVGRTAAGAHARGTF
jgi:hypothetical protein